VNPTGMIYTPAQLRMYLAFCRANGPGLPRGTPICARGRPRAEARCTHPCSPHLPLAPPLSLRREA
jgi:hypothetical protein